MTVVDYSTLRGVEGYKAAFPNALRGLEGKRLRAVVEGVHSGVLEGWRPTEENVAEIAQSRESGQMTSEEAQAICDRVRARRARSK
ncbi:hypothetical protein [Corynebacterium suicordis]|uniref:Antitoxin VbhA domain-containing protein n=1 Tax=Corynebacterium suicordis DSM 45110 TaxID=1121369 RepID=A0ABR9ZMU5_9CORY|nr:hypothetical protein [Corynebacterium suicordis]MBF4554396.1 hypothetical protein [Corynebacterium suicordis DSM 45110]MDR6278579.1 cell filamentation protein [Corynebacterium suicordis]